MQNRTIYGEFLIVIKTIWKQSNFDAYLGKVRIGLS